MLGCPSSAWHSLLGFTELAATCIFGYDTAAQKLIAPPPSASWILQWVLLFHSPKHRFVSGSRPDLKFLATDARAAMQKFLWRLHFQSTSSCKPLVPSFRNMVSDCHPMYGSLAYRWASHFKRVWLDLASSPKTPVAGQYTSNLYGLVKFGFNELQRSELVCIPLDKQPGFVLVSPLEFSKMEFAALSSLYHVPWPMSFVNHRTVLDEYAKLAQDIGAFHEDSKLAVNIRSSVIDGSFVCPLGMTVKAHKPQGAQTIRSIHKAGNPWNAGLSKWLVTILEPHAQAIAWSYKDSFSVRDAILAVPISDTTIVAQVDLKDFFLSGDSLDIAITISSLFSYDECLRSLVHRALLLLLEAQFVVTNTLTSTYKCVAGSGIGLMVSAVVASLFFFVKVEQHCIPAARGLIKWVRYHDDVLAFFDARSSMEPFFRGLKSRASTVFRVVIEAVHSQGAQFVFLDLFISLVPPQVIIVAAQHKPLRPLCPTSAHAPAIHRAWPGGVAHRVFTLSNRDPSALSTLIRRYREVGTHPFTLRNLECWALRATSRQSQSSSALIVPFVIRFHPTVQWAFSRALALVPPPSELNVTIFPAWRNALPSLMGKVQRSNWNSCFEGFGCREGVSFCFGGKANLLKTNKQEFNVLKLAELQVR